MRPTLNNEGHLWLALSVLLVATAAVLSSSGLHFTPDIAKAEVDQKGYVWRNDDGTEVTATSAATESTAIDIPANQSRRLRIGVTGTGVFNDMDTNTLFFDPGEAEVGAAIIDTENGFAYFGTISNPAQIVKVQLSDFTKVDIITLDPGISGISSAAIDPTTDLGYFGTNGSPGKIVQVDLDTFAPVDDITLSSGENVLSSAVIDTDAGFLYVGTDTDPGIVVRINLDTFTRDSALTLNAGDTQLRAAIIDPDAGLAYFGTATSPGLVVKVDLDTFTRDSALTLNAGENNVKAAVIDTVNGFAYLGTESTPGVIVKMDLSPFSRIDALVFDDTIDENDIRAAAIDVPGQYAYFAFKYGLIYRVDLTDFSLGATTTASGSGNDTSTLLLDEARGRLYVADANVADGQVEELDFAEDPDFHLEFSEKVDPDCHVARVTIWEEVPMTATTGAFEFAPSANLTEGAATTDNTTVTNGANAFLPGVVRESTNATGTFAFSTRRIREFEYSIRPTSNATVGALYCFRLRDFASESDAPTDGQYATFPEATVVAAAATSSSGGSACQRPSIRVNLPNGGETLHHGQRIPIFWTADGCASEIVLTLTTGGTTPGLRPVAKGLYPPPGYFLWTIPPDVTSEDVRIVADLMQSGSVLASDTSDLVFSVSAPKTLNLVEGSGGTKPPIDDAKSPAEAIDEELGISGPPVSDLCAPGTVIRGTGAALYHCGADGKKHLFPNLKTYGTWYDGFTGINRFSDNMLERIPLGNPVPYRPGSRLVKIVEDPKVFSVHPRAVLRWIMDETVARMLYGTGWASLVDDLPSSLFQFYTIGEPITGS